MLASSVELSPSASRQLLITSDFPVGDDATAGHGYLTGIPMDDVGLYAFSSTWPAPEMPRPGCVWTHTLLVPYSTLARIKDLGVLLTSFRRPGVAQGRRDYTSVLELADADPDVGRSEPAEREVAQALLRALYGEPGREVVVLAREATSFAMVNQLICTIWSQQWPRLRRDFRFCTRKSLDRVTSKVGYDLQVARSVGSVPRGSERSGPAIVDVDATHASQVEMSDEAVREQRACPWQSWAWRDLASSTSFRSFLKRYGADASTGRAAYAGLAMAYQALAIDDQSMSAEAFGRAIAAWFAEPAELATLKSDVLNGRIGFAAAEGFSPVGRLRFLLELLRVTPGVITSLDRPSLEDALVQGCMRLTPEERWGFIGEVRDWLGDDNRDLVTLSLVSGVTVEELISHVGQDWPLYVEMSRHDPALLFDSRVLAVPVVRRAAVDCLRRSHTDDALDLACFVDDRLLAQDVFRHMPEAAATRVLDAMDRETRLPDCWLDVAFGHARQLLDALNGEAPRRQSTLLALLSRLGVRDPEVSSMGLRPWADALRIAIGPLPGGDRLSLSAQLFALAIRRPTSGAETLLSFSFDNLHEAARTSVHSDAWADLDRELPNGWDVFSWDRCRRLRNAVCDAYMGGALDPAAFLLVTRSSKLLRRLIDEVSWRWGGPHFLRLVVQGSKDPNRKTKKLLSEISNIVSL